VQKDRYSHASHTYAVKRGASELGVRLGSRIVLDCLCDRAEFDRPQVTITKPQIVKHTGLERKAVQRGLQYLRELGVIDVLRGIEGGRGKAVTYALVVKGNKAKDPLKQKSAGLTASQWARHAQIMKDERCDYGSAMKILKNQLLTENS